MKLDKKTRTKLDELIRDKPDITKAEVKELIQLYAGAPDVEKLIDMDYGRTANRLMANYKDDDHVRIWFAGETFEGETKFINIEKSENVEDVRSVAKQLKRKADGLIRAFNKSNNKLAVLEGQISVFDIVDGRNDTVCSNDTYAKA